MEPKALDSPHLSSVQHGGNLARAEAEFGKPAEGWLDLSTGINPTPYPVKDIPATNWHRLPDSADLAALDVAARHYFKAPLQAEIVAAPGTQMILQWLPTQFERTSVAIVEPTYGEHRLCWARAGHEISSVKTLAQGVKKGQIVVVVNPNNPDGRRYKEDALREAAKALSEKNGLLVIDGAFEDMEAWQASATLSGIENLVVLRSFGKFFGLAGLRLGFALCPPALGHRLREAIGPWSVSQPAIAAGCKAMTDDRWISNAKIELSQNTEELLKLLAPFPATLLGGTTLFQLIETEDGKALYRHLAEAGILTRPFRENPRWLRLGLPANVQERKRLCEALESYGGWR